MNIFVKRIIAFVIFIFAMNFSLQAFSAEHYKLVLFYADWNVYSTQATEVLTNVANKYSTVSFEKINIDDIKTFMSIKRFGFMPKTIPYCILTDNKNRLIYATEYTPNSSQMLVDIIEKHLND